MPGSDEGRGSDQVAEARPGPDDGTITTESGERQLDPDAVDPEGGSDVVERNRRRAEERTTPGTSADETAES